MIPKRVNYYTPPTIQDYITVKKIRDFKKLEKGWHYGEGELFKDSMLDNAIALIREAFNLAFYTTDAFPGLNGEVLCTIYHGEHYLEFILEPDGSVTFSREKKGHESSGEEEICYQEGLSLQDAKEKIGEFGKEIWNTYAFSTRNITTTRENIDSTVLLSKIQGKNPAYRSLTNVASSSQGRQSANIFKNITSESQQFHRYFGVFQKSIYQAVVG
jgi:hypothetical protein